METFSAESTSVTPTMIPVSGQPSTAAATPQQVIVVNVPQDFFGNSNNEYANDKAMAVSRKNKQVVRELYLQGILLFSSILMMIGVYTILREYERQHGDWMRIVSRDDTDRSGLWRFIKLLFYNHHDSNSDVTPAIVLIAPCMLTSIVVVIVAIYKYKMKENAKIDLFETFLKISLMHTVFYVCGYFGLRNERERDEDVQLWVTSVIWYAYLVIQGVMTINQSFYFAVHSGFERTRKIGTWRIVIIKFFLIISMFLYAGCIAAGMYMMNPKVSMYFLFASGASLTAVWGIYTGIFLCTRDKTCGTKICVSEDA